MAVELRRNTGTFDYWVTDRISISLVHNPRLGDTGDFDLWLWDRCYWGWYVSPPSGPFPVFFKP
jgi:hypothetical protein